MTKDEEIKMLLRGIEGLRSELAHCSFDSDLFEHMEKYKRLNNLLSCLSTVCWTIYGDRHDDKEENYEVNSVSQEGIKIAN